MVRRLLVIFDHPKPPSVVTEDQFDGLSLDSVAKAPWHVRDPMIWLYLDDLTYVDLQQDLFDYLFPLCLILWWDSQIDREHWKSDLDLYFPLDRGHILEKMMSLERRAEVVKWIADAYVEGVDAWGGKLSVKYNARGPSLLHGPLETFHALGLSVPCSATILVELADIRTAGRAQFWLVLLAGLAFVANQVPFIPAYDSRRGGGGVYLNMHAANHVFDHGYLAANSEVVRHLFSPTFLMSELQVAMGYLSNPREVEWANLVLQQIESNPEVFDTRLSQFLGCLDSPDLQCEFDDE